MTGRIPQDFINQVLARTDIIDILQARIKLTHKGQNHSGLCPFHQEKTPSFSANQSKQFYYCFGCGASGNAIGFVMQYDQLNFREAVEYLATQIGLQLPQEMDQDPTKDFSALYCIMDKVNNIYQQQLKNATQAIDYLKNRGLTGKIAKAFNIGYAPNSWDFISNTFTQREQQEQLVQTGMLGQKEQRYYDRFRGRIMFPIRDIRARIVGFGGRSLSDDNPPKYLNSPETDIFHKNFELFGLYESKIAQPKIQHLLVVEGYMDVIALHQFGLTEAVATLGTAINQHHIKKLLRYTKNITFCFDGDSAGQKAAWKAVCTSLPLLNDGVCIKIFTLPAEHDPDSLIRQFGLEKFKQAMQSSPELPQTLFSNLKTLYPTNNLSGKASFAKEAALLINTMPQGIFKQLLLDQLANHLNVDKAGLDNLLNSHESNHPSFTSNAEKSDSHFDTPELTSPLNPAMLAAAILIQNPQLIHTITPPALDTNHSSEQHFLHKLIMLTQSTQNLSTGQLLQLCTDNQRGLFVALAAHDLPLPDDQLLAELLGAFQRLAEQKKQKRLNHLIQKAKYEQLSSDEKALLKQLLQTKVKNN